MTNFLEKKYVTKNGYCKWCAFKHFGNSDLEIRVTKHCKKMIDRALSRKRVGDKCHHCGHNKKEHRGQQYSDNGIKDSKMTLELTTCCSHQKTRVDANLGHEDFCDCEVFL